MNLQSTAMHGALFISREDAGIGCVLCTMEDLRLFHQKKTKGDLNRMKQIVSTEAYIGKLKECLKAKDDFKDLRYVRSAKGDEYAVL